MFRIPNIIHQTWKDSHLPEHLKTFSQTWKHHHPQFKYILWTDEMILMLLRCFEPQLVSLFRSFTIGPQKADVARYVILKHIGGWYADLDTECLRPLHSTLPNYCREREVIVSKQLGVVEIVVIGSVPNHPLWNAVLRQLIQLTCLSTFRSCLKSTCRDFDVLCTTGPYFFDSLLTQYRTDKHERFETIELVPSEYFYAYPIVFHWWPWQDYRSSISLHKSHGVWMQNPIILYGKSCVGSLYTWIIITVVMLMMLWRSKVKIVVSEFGNLKKRHTDQFARG